MPTLPGQPRHAVSLPYCPYGDVLAPSTEDGSALRAQCVEYVLGLGIRRVEVRALDPNPGEADEVTLRLDLPDSVERLWQHVGPKVRNQVRKAEKLELKARWGRDQVDLLYDLYASNMGRLGTPVHSRRFFREIVSQFGSDCDILSVGTTTRIMGAMLVIKHAGCWSDPFAATNVAFNDRNPGMFMYWEALRAACESAARMFDFGRSHRDSGTYRFKRQWGAITYPLHYSSFIDGQPFSRSMVDLYRGSTAGLASRAWRRLPPLVQRTLGPSMRRWMP
jgi:FemAB-related protein (PEP-CTERM system-associated)